MTFDASLPAGDGVENLGNSVADIVLHHPPYEKAGQKDTHHRIDQIEVVGFCGVEVFGQEILYPVYQHLQYQSCQCREDTYQKTKYQDELFLLDVLFAP